MSEAIEDWTYPASGWHPGDRVEIDSETHPWHGELGRVIEQVEPDEGEWSIRLDDGLEVVAYGYELTGVVSTGGAS